MRFQILNVETDQWHNKIVEASDMTGETKTYTISPKDKKTGNLFPNFKAIREGFELEGNAWTSPTNGKNYIFPPKTITTKGSNFKNVQMEKAMDKKAAQIGVAQDNKELGIKISSTINHAVDISIAQWNYDKTQSMEDLINYWREFLWTHWEAKDTDFPPMP